jgi:hypothetical protein
MTPDQSERIIAQLATLAEGMTGLRRDIERQDQAFAEEREDSHNSRRELHDKVNAVASDVATVKGDVKVAALVAAQARDEVKDLKKTVENAAPSITDVQNAKKFGTWILGGGAAAAIGSGLAIFAWGEQFKGWLAHWLGLR